MRAKAKNLGFQAWRVSHSAVTGIDAETTFTAEYDPRKRHLEVEIPALKVGSARLQGKLDLTRPEDANPRVRIVLKMPRQDCSMVSASVPNVLIPRLKGLKVAGTISVDASLKVDLENPKTLKLKVDGETDSCKILSLGSEIQIEDLKKDLYEHNPVEPERGRLDHITVGPGTPEWVPSRMLPSFVKAAAVVTEDRSFYSHKGVRWDLIGRAQNGQDACLRWFDNHQQLVKNLT